jgi:hypothetical protein
MNRKATYPVSQLDLDTINPRGNPEDNQTAALRSLFLLEKDAEKVFALAVDICTIGMLDPGDRLYVIKSLVEPDRYVVLDGNRRLTTLRLLSQSSLLEREDIGLSPSLRTRFKRLQKEQAGRWPTEVDVVVFDSRETANHFIRLRHTGENLGSGRSAWSALQIARFDKTGLWQCIAQLRDDSALTLEVLNSLTRSEFPITNFERVAATSDFQDRFGYSLSKHAFLLVGDQKRAYAALSKLAADVVSGKVDSRGMFAEAKLMSPYFEEVEAAIAPPAPPPPPPAPSPAPPSSGPTPAPAPAPGTGDTGSHAGGAGPEDDEEGDADGSSPYPAPSPPRKPRARLYLIDKKDLVMVTNPKCRELIDELKGKVAVGTAPIACALLFRALLELTAELYLTAMGQAPVTNKTTNIDKATGHLLGNAHPTDPSDKKSIAEAFKGCNTAYEELSQAAHSHVSGVSPEHVRTSWRNYGGGIDLLWRRIHHETVTKKVASA